MKDILYLTYAGFPSPNQGGANKIIYELLSYINLRNYNISVLSYEFENSFLFDVQITDNQSRRISIKKRLGKYFYKNCSLYRYITSSDLYMKYYLQRIDNHFIKKLKYYSQNSIIHSHDGLVSYYPSCNKSLKNVLTIHSKGTISSEMKVEKKTKNKSSVFFDNWISEVERRERFSFLHSEVITFPSRAAKNYYLEDLNLNDDNKDIRIIYNGIDIEFIESCTDGLKLLSEFGIIKNNYDLIILNVAAHVPEKNIDIILDVISELKKHTEKKILFIQIGSGFLKSDLEKKVRKLELKDSVKFLGNLSNNKVIGIMKCCDIFLMTSEKVIFDLVILEALAAGICVMASNDGGNKEIINDGFNGYLFELNNMQDLISKILNFVPGKTRMNAKLTAKQFSVQKMTDEYCKLYEELLA